jgi:hypothetical protein
MDNDKENELYKILGKIEAKLEEYHTDTQKVLKIITGNGKPEDGMLFILHNVQKTQKECPISQVVEKVNEIDKKIEIQEKTNNLFYATWQVIKEHPKTSLTIFLVVSSLLGFSATNILKFLTLVNEIAQKVGVISP